MVSSGESKEMVNKKIAKVLKCSKCSFKTSITKNKSKSRQTIKKHEAAYEGDKTSHVMGAKVDQDADKIGAVTEKQAPKVDATGKKARCPFFLFENPGDTLPKI